MGYKYFCKFIRANFNDNTYVGFAEIGQDIISDIKSFISRVITGKIILRNLFFWALHGEHMKYIWSTYEYMHGVYMCTHMEYMLFIDTHIEYVLFIN